MAILNYWDSIPLHTNLLENFQYVTYTSSVIERGAVNLRVSDVVQSNEIIYTGMGMEMPLERVRFICRILGNSGAAEFPLQ